MMQPAESEQLTVAECRGWAGAGCVCIERESWAAAAYLQHQYVWALQGAAVSLVFVIDSADKCRQV